MYTFKVVIATWDFPLNWTASLHQQKIKINKHDHIVTAILVQQITSNFQMLKNHWKMHIGNIPHLTNTWVKTKHQPSPSKDEKNAPRPIVADQTFAHWRAAKAFRCTSSKEAARWHGVSESCHSQVLIRHPNSLFWVLRGQITQPILLSNRNEGRRNRERKKKNPGHFWTMRLEVVLQWCKTSGNESIPRFGGARAVGWVLKGWWGICPNGIIGMGGLSWRVVVLVANDELGWCTNYNLWYPLGMHVWKWVRWFFNFWCPATFVI